MDDYSGLGAFGIGQGHEGYAQGPIGAMAGEMTGAEEGMQRADAGMMSPDGGPLSEVERLIAGLFGQGTPTISDAMPTDMFRGMLG